MKAGEFVKSTTSDSAGIQSQNDVLESLCSLGIQGGREEALGNLIYNARNRVAPAEICIAGPYHDYIQGLLP